MLRVPRGVELLVVSACRRVNSIAPNERYNHNIKSGGDAACVCVCVCIVILGGWFSLHGGSRTPLPFPSLLAPVCAVCRLCVSLKGARERAEALELRGRCYIHLGDFEMAGNHFRQVGVLFLISRQLLVF